MVVSLSVFSFDFGFSMAVSGSLSKYVLRMGKK